jgi:hypothetical protein
MKVYVSLTSIFDNQNILLLTLMSIRNQTVIPDKCFIFLSEDEKFKDKGFPDKKITNPGLIYFLNQNKDLFEVKWVSNTGPYRKLLPLLEEKWKEDCVIITIDDDTEYNENFVKNMICDYEKNLGNFSIGYRSFKMPFDNFDDISTLNYDSFSIIGLNESSVYNFATGKGGVLYSPKFFDRVKDIIFRDDLYMSFCPTNDDVWFNILRIANKITLTSGSMNNQFMDRDRINSDCALYFNYNSTSNNKFIINVIEFLKAQKII